MSRIQGQKKGVRSGSHLHDETGRAQKDIQTNTQGSSAQGSAAMNEYLGSGALGFLFRLTLLRAHEKGGEHGPNRGGGRKGQCAPNLWLSPSDPPPLTGVPNPYFLDPVPTRPYTLGTPHAE